MITHIEDAFEQCPDCGCAVPPARVDPPAPDYGRDEPGRPPRRPSFEPDCCPTCGYQLTEDSDAGDGGGR
jgi:hypothetical protein